MTNKEWSPWKPGRGDTVTVDKRLGKIEGQHGSIVRIRYDEDEDEILDLDYTDKVIQVVVSLSQ